MNRLFDAAGHDLHLGGKIGRGGEGTVFEIIGNLTAAAKVYHQHPGPEKADKLSTMAQQANSSILEIAAWPTTTLHGSRNGKILGIVMPRLVGYHPIHQLYSPAQRQFGFPRADWSFLVHTARNLAQAFATVHKQGHVVGDVNQGNILVSLKAMIKFIDCDSFQISAGGRTYLCEVGVGHFTPPELQGQPFGGLTRTPNHDDFGLAVLCFHLLFMGRHPFVGKFLGSGDMPIERAIREFRFAFGQAANTRQMTPPPHILRLAGVSRQISSLFEGAFSEHAARNGLRPTAAEWVAALDLLRTELKTCSRYVGHKYHHGLGDCPWCAIERGGGPDFFISVTSAVRSASGHDVQALWAVISQVPLPQDSSDAPVFTPAVPPALKPLPTELRRLKILRTVSGWGSLAALAGVIFGALPPGVWFLVLTLTIVWLIVHNNRDYERERTQRQETFRRANAVLQAMNARWQHEVGDVQNVFHATRRALEENRAEYESLGPVYQRDRNTLNAKREENHRRRFLEQHLVQRANIRGVGPGLKTTLASYGIETAADVKYGSVAAVPGFGPVKTRELVAWRAKLEQAFRFDPTKGVDPVDIAALDQRYAVKRQELERALQNGPQTLRRLSSKAAEMRSQLLPELKRLSIDLAQAKADASVA